MAPTSSWNFFKASRSAGALVFLTVASSSLPRVSRNFLAQTQDGTVCYYGEDVDIYQGGVITSHESQWRAGVSGALPGILHDAAGEA